MTDTGLIPVPWSLLTRCLILRELSMTSIESSISEPRSTCMSSFGKSVCRKTYGILVVIIYRAIYEQGTAGHNMEKCHLDGCLNRHRDSLCGLRAGKALHLNVLSTVVSLSYCSRHVGKGQHEAALSHAHMIT